MLLVSDGVKCKNVCRSLQGTETLTSWGPSWKGFHLMSRWSSTQGEFILWGPGMTQMKSGANNSASMAHGSWRVWSWRIKAFQRDWSTEGRWTRVWSTDFKHKNSKNEETKVEKTKTKHEQRHRLWTDQSLLMPRTQREARSHDQFTRQRQTLTDSHQATIDSSITFQPRHAPERKEMHYSTCGGRSQTRAPKVRTRLEP